jgi:hypothetical protein
MADQRGFGFEILDLMIGPGKKADKLQFQGALIIEVRSGAGTFTFAGQTRELSLGGILSVPDRTDLGIVNRDPKTPLILRGTLIHGASQ